MDISTIALISSTNLLALCCAAAAFAIFYFKFLTGNETANAESNGLQRPRGPIQLPIIGAMASFYGYDVPYQAFGDLAKKYGSIVRLRFGSMPAILVNGLDNIKEVLITKSTHFENRPDLARFHSLFKGYKQNCECSYYFSFFICLKFSLLDISVNILQ